MLWEICAPKPRREDKGQRERGVCGWEAAEEEGVSEEREVWRERPEQARERGERARSEWHSLPCVK